MKPANILVFKDFRVKVGDLGVSIKMWDALTYQLKGITQGYVSDEILDAFKKRTFLNRDQLFESDRHAIIRTFEKCNETDWK